MSKRAYTPRQQAAEQLRVAEQLLVLSNALAHFDRAWGDASPVPDPVAAAWNSVHDAVRALEAHRQYVELNPRVNLTGQEAELARLVSLNID